MEISELEEMRASLVGRGRSLALASRFCSGDSSLSKDLSKIEAEIKCIENIIAAAKAKKKK